MGEFFNVNGTSIVDSSETLYVRSVRANVLSFASFGPGGLGTNKSAGYSAFGNEGIPPSSPTMLHAVQKINFANDATSTFISAPTGIGRKSSSSVGSQTDGFVTAGHAIPSPGPAQYKSSGLKYPFASGAAVSPVSNISTVIRYNHSSCQSMNDGYNIGGLPSSPSVTTVIDKFPFASSHTAVSFSSLSAPQTNNSVRQTAGASSLTHGYVAGGITTPPFTNLSSIYKFPFTNSVVSAYNVASLVTLKSLACGVPNGEFAYIGGGDTPPSAIYASDSIEKFSMATDANATDIGNLSSFKRELTPHVSATHGYMAGGVGPNPSSGGGPPPYAYGIAINTVDKFPFSSDGNASDVADLVSNQGSGAGTQG